MDVLCALSAKARSVGFDCICFSIDDVPGLRVSLVSVEYESLWYMRTTSHNEEFVKGLMFHSNILGYVPEIVKDES